jgi:ArsR family transcriptional regulator
MATEAVFSTDQEALARFSKALSHPVRLYILDFLAKNTSKCCYSGDMAEELPIARSTLSQHLKELKNAGLIQGEINPPYIRYCINRTNWELAKSLMERFFAVEQTSDTEPKRIFLAQTQKTQKT